MRKFRYVLSVNQKTPPKIVVGMNGLLVQDSALQAVKQVPRVLTRGAPFAAVLIMLLNAVPTPATALNDVPIIKEADDLPLLSSEEFFGDTIILEHSCPSKIRNVNWTVILPNEHKLLLDASPNIILYSGDKPLKKIFLTAESGAADFGQEAGSGELSALMSLFYCKEGNEGLCLLRKVLYKIKLDENLPVSDLDLVYFVPAEE